MMNERVGFAGAVLVGLLLAWVASGRLGYTVSADEVGPASATSLQAADVGPEHGAFERPAGVEYQLADTGIEAYKVSLAPLWTWDGDVGTYVDGQTRVRIVTQAGRVTGVEIITNASAIENACLEAQLLYGLSVDGAGVASACAGMWTQAWAEAQAGANNQGD